jgi:hypothetical protein
MYVCMDRCENGVALVLDATRAAVWITRIFGVDSEIELKVNNHQGQPESNH